MGHRARFFSIEGHKVAFWSIFVQKQVYQDAVTLCTDCLFYSVLLSQQLLETIYNKNMRKRLRNKSSVYENLGNL